MTSIPTSVLNLLRQEWKIDDHSTFEDNFREDIQRQNKPSYYNIWVGRKVENDFDVFSHLEAKFLVDQNVFGPLATSDSKGVILNEHAQHALSDFLSEAYTAWKRFEERLAEVERTGAFPQHEP